MNNTTGWTQFNSKQYHCSFQRMQLIRPYLGMQMSGLADVWLCGAEEASFFMVVNF